MPGLDSAADPDASISAGAKGSGMFPRFSLVLMVNHACNLRCTYCYTGAKFGRAMSRTVAMRAVDRAVHSIGSGGTLELG